MEKPEHTNDLIKESSPYLLQHAHNPVDWKPWNDSTLKLARELDKPMLVSIGYSACHWCHVMEHESFEDSTVADYMNEHFVCVKVDREERPDVDQVYMDAVQLMTGSGGWPLNCFTTPDGRPFFGGTYFPKKQWLSVMEQLVTLYHNDREKVEEYADRLSEGLHKMDQRPLASVPKTFDDSAVKKAVAQWKTQFDPEDGGPNRAPKFPMPNNLDFMLAYAVEFHDNALLGHVELTLKKMAHGGIYDQIGGGFARYSTDAEWKVPHFEKMLYDNAQLLSTYSNAYLHTHNPLYKEIGLGIAQWLKSEMLQKDGAFYSALDADSEGVEGKFYTFTKEELQSIAGDDFPIIQDYFHIDRKGLWEHGQFILLRTEDAVQVAQKHNINEASMAEKVNTFKVKALAYRSKRVRPGLDDKCLMAWNAMCSEGLVELSIATGDDQWAEMAKNNLDFLCEKMRRPDGGLWHTYKNGQATINAYLDDYAHLISALIKMYEYSADERYILTAQSLVEYVHEHFDKNNSGMFYFKSKDDMALVAQKAELHDNVIPASNSVLATCLFKLARIFGNPEWQATSDHMLAQVQSGFEQYPSGHSQWMMLNLYHLGSFREVAVVGKNCWQIKRAIQQQYLPMTVICASKAASEIPLLSGKYVDGETRIYVCENGACHRPTTSLEVALELLRDSD